MASSLAFGATSAGKLFMNSDIFILDFDILEQRRISKNLILRVLRFSEVHYLQTEERTSRSLKGLLLLEV